MLISHYFFIKKNKQVKLFKMYLKLGSLTNPHAILNIIPLPQILTNMITLFIWRFFNCCCHRRIVSNRQIQILMLPTNTDFPTPLMSIQRVELRSCRRSLINRGLYWSSITGKQNKPNTILVDRINQAKSSS